MATFFQEMDAFGITQVMDMIHNAREKAGDMQNGDVAEAITTLQMANNYNLASPQAIVGAKNVLSNELARQGRYEEAAQLAQEAKDDAEFYRGFGYDADESKHF